MEAKSIEDKIILYRTDFRRKRECFYKYRARKLDDDLKKRTLVGLGGLVEKQRINIVITRRTVDNVYVYTIHLKG